MNSENTTHNDGCETSNSVSRRETLDCLTKEENEERGRRGVLRGAIASVVASLGFTNVATAIESPETRKLRLIENELNRFEEQVHRQYENKEQVQQQIQAHGSDILDLLSEKGYISEPTISELDDGFVEVDAVYEDDKSTFSSYLRIETEIEEGQLGVNVLPEAGLQYAVIVDSKSKEATVLDPVSGMIDTDAYQVLSCLGANCACDEYYVTCSVSGCWKDGKTGETCCDCGDLNCRYVC